MVSRHYDFLKNLAQLWIPGFATLYFTIAEIWHLPYGAEVVGTLTAIDTFLGVILRISTGKYIPPSDGQLIIDKSDPEMGRLVMNIETPLDQIPDKDHVRLTVHPAPDPGGSQG
jgi:Putative phage holin Dp-1